MRSASTIILPGSGCGRVSGYTVEIRRAGRFSVEHAKKREIPQKYWNRLQKGEEIETEDGAHYTPDMVLGAARKGIKVTYCTDTRPTESLVASAKNSDLLICEGMYAEKEKIAKAISEKDNIEMVWNSNVVKLIGDDKVEGITVKNSVDGLEKDIQVSGLFIAVGQEPDNYDFEEVVELDDKGYVVAGEDCKTESRGIFTAGDCRTKNVRQLTTAASDGAVAAKGACEYIDSELGTKNTK